MMQHLIRFRVFLFAALMLVLTAPAAQSLAQIASPYDVRLAYVWQNTVTLADGDGVPLEQTGPSFAFGQGARLVWTADGSRLYIALDNGLYETGGQGGPAVQVPGIFGRTLTFTHDTGVLYYLETTAPQDEEPGIVSFPLREANTALMSGGTGKLAGYFGRFASGTTRANLTFAAALYARDGGLLGPGRPTLWPSYGSNLFGTCCFPDPGLGIFTLGTESYSVWDATFMPGAAATNTTQTYLAGPTTNGVIRIIDLITGGTRDYAIQIAGGLGTIERVAWSPDDTMLYFISRYNPTTPLMLNVETRFPVDTSSADVTLYRLNLVTSTIEQLAWRADVYGISSLAATNEYVFATVVDSNAALINAFNTQQVAASLPSSDALLAPYMPQTHLWRVAVDGSSVADVRDDVWGLAARPIR
ncbi:PD40 domain-containing protein [Aggregatilinea lenta]|uniref:PD40 domain-containing protein n=1 Tax=Aggregatilinea lenta TaxID=913108 RepID=UPI000E5A2995|nr:PD40 domain-containing protein [Aggregatilinea lenta]